MKMIELLPLLEQTNEHQQEESADQRPTHDQHRLHLGHSSKLAHEYNDLRDVRMRIGNVCKRLTILRGGCLVDTSLLVLGYILKPGFIVQM